MKKQATTKILIGILTISALFFSCKKNDRGPNPEGSTQRIKSISDGSQATIFEYDHQGRIIRLYYNASASLKFTYSPAGVNMQRLGSGDMPDPDRKTDFSIVDGRIVNGTEYFPDKQTHRFYYVYDSKNRLIQIIVHRQYDGSTYETHQYMLAYNTQNNVQQINFVRKNTGVENTDSIVITRTYYDKRFITWADMGFGYFGTAAFGQEHLGYGITVPFYLAAYIYPSGNSLKSQTEDAYSWNPVTKKWAFQSTNSYTRPESDYEYDAGGRLIKHAGRNIEWK